MHILIDGLIITLCLLGWLCSAAAAIYQTGQEFWFMGITIVIGVLHIINRAVQERKRGEL